MTTDILTLFCVILTIGLVVVIAAAHRQIRRLRAEIDAAEENTKQVRAQGESEVARVRQETEQAVREAQKYVDQQVVEIHEEGERVRQQHEAAARRIIEATQAQLVDSLAKVESLSQYASLQDAEAEVRATLDAAMSEATALRTQAQNVLQQARSLAEAERVKATEKATSVYEQADARMSQATRDAGRVVAEAEKRAKEIAGEAHDALRDKQLLERAAEAMRNIVDGYGERYIIPTHSILDDLAVEFGYTSAGESLKSSREQTRRMVVQGEAATCEYVEANRRQTAIRFVVDAFNGRVDAILTRVKRDNYGSLEQEIRDAFALVNLNGKAFRDARVHEAYLTARLAELKWAVVVQELARQQLEEQREIKARMRDEERARKEYERQLAEAAKEEESRRKALEEKERDIAAARLELEHAAAKDKAALEQKIAAMEQANQALVQDLAAATAKSLSIAQQTKKGHVYIISNVGAFGEGVYKIGQTRRLNKQDRIDELGDASVPFDFDVHAWIESENAPALEHRLQKRFLTMQINKMNSRKEFFRVTLKSIREEVERLSQGEAFTVTHWTDTADAAQYRESCDIESDPQKLQKWLTRQEALADRVLRLDSLHLTSVDVEESPTREEDGSAVAPSAAVVQN